MTNNTSKHSFNFFLLGVGVCVIAFALLTGGFDRCTTMPGGLKFGEYTTSKVLVCGFKVPT